MLVHYPKLVYHVKDLGCYLQGQGHSEGLSNQNMTVLAISSELMIFFLQPNLTWWQSTISQSIL